MNKRDYMLRVVLKLRLSASLAVNNTAGEKLKAAAGIAPFTYLPNADAARRNILSQAYSHVIPSVAGFICNRVLQSMSPHGDPARAAVRELQNKLAGVRRRTASDR